MTTADHRNPQDATGSLQPPCTLHPGWAALVLDSPHSGQTYPPDFRPACPLQALRAAEDTDVDALWDFAPRLGIPLLLAHFPRSYIDANRAIDEIDLSMIDGPWDGPVRPGAKVRLGRGLIWRRLDDGTPVYDRLLTPDEVRARISRCWEPYHRLLDKAIAEAHARHGHVIHLNCHSMPSIADAFSTEHPFEAHADFVLGDRDGSTADPALTERIASFLKERGYSVAINHPYKGVEIVRRQGDPARHIHSIQVEVNRKLYMDEPTRARAPGFAALKTTLHALAHWLLTLTPRAGVGPAPVSDGASPGLGRAHPGR